ncbi:hypothetical protein EWB00_000214, partial [Schistosoma japonicum]
CEGSTACSMGQPAPSAAVTFGQFQQQRQLTSAALRRKGSCEGEEKKVVSDDDSDESMALGFV